MVVCSAVTISATLFESPMSVINISSSVFDSSRSTETSGNGVTAAAAVTDDVGVRVSDDANVVGCCLKYSDKSGEITISSSH